MVFQVLVNYSLLTIHYSFFCHSFERLLITPAAGFRFRETGDLASVGTVLACWSASSNAVGSGNAGDLWCHAGDVKPLDVSGRAYGFSVRCVQNLRLLLSFILTPEDKACKERYVANNLLPTSVIARSTATRQSEQVL